MSYYGFYNTAHSQSVEKLALKKTKEVVMRFIITAIKQPRYWPHLIIGSITLICLVCGSLTGVTILTVRYLNTVISPYRLLLSRLDQSVVQDIEAGKPPVSMEISAKECADTGGCQIRHYDSTWTVTYGQKYLEITLINTASGQTHAAATISRVYLPKDTGNLVCDTGPNKPYGEDLVQDWQVTLSCYNQLNVDKLPGEVCFDFTFAELYLDKLPAEHPEITICKLKDGNNTYK